MMTEKKIACEHNGKRYEGMLVYDGGVAATRPVIFMRPDRKGVCADAIAQARIVAGKDYVVLMADMFGAACGGNPFG